MKLDTFFGNESQFLGTPITRRLVKSNAFILQAQTPGIRGSRLVKSEL